MQPGFPQRPGAPRPANLQPPAGGAAPAQPGAGAGAGGAGGQAQAIKMIGGMLLQDNAWVMALVQKMMALTQGQQGGAGAGGPPQPPQPPAGPGGM